VESHEDASTALSGGALAAKTLDLAVRVDLVVLQDRHLDLLALMLAFLGGVVGLLLALLRTTTQTENEVEGRLLLDVVVAESATILKLFACKDQTLLVGRDPFFILDFGLDIVDRVRRLDFKSDGFAREGLYEDLHLTEIGRLCLSNEPRWSL